MLELSQQLFIEYFNDLDEANDVKLSEICIIKYGKNLPTKKIMPSGHPIYGGNGIIGYYNEKMYTRSQVLISCRGAASGKALFTKPNCFVTNNSLILECKDKYYYYLKEFSLLNNYYQYATGSAQPQITIENIKDIPIKIPNEKVLAKYNPVFSSIDSQYFKNIEQVETLTQLRDTLLPKLMNGEIDLENIEI